MLKFAMKYLIRQDEVEKTNEAKSGHSAGLCRWNWTGAVQVVPMDLGQPLIFG